MPARVHLPSLDANGTTTVPPSAQPRTYQIPDKIVQVVTEALMTHKKTRGGSMKDRLMEFSAIYRYNVNKRTTIKYTFENTTPEVARDATICWWKGNKQIKAVNPRFSNTASARIDPILSIILLMVYLEDPAFLAVLHHYKGGAIVEETTTTRKGTPTAASQAKSRKRQHAENPSRGEEPSHADAAADDADGSHDKDSASMAVEDAPLPGPIHVDVGGQCSRRGGTSTPGGETHGASNPSRRDGHAGAASQCEVGGSSAAAGLTVGGRGGAANRGAAGVAVHRAVGSALDSSSRAYNSRPPLGDRGGTAKRLGAAVPASSRGRDRSNSGRSDGHHAAYDAATDNDHRATAAAALAAECELVAPLVASSVHMSGALVGTGSICPEMEEYHGSILSPDVVSVFLEQISPGARSMTYPFALHAQYCLEPNGVGPLPTTLAQCGSMSRSVWSIESIGYVLFPYPCCFPPRRRYLFTV